MNRLIIQFDRSLNEIKKKILVLKVLKHRDPEAFGSLYDIYVASIYRFIYFKTGRVEEAEDLTAETFLKTWQYITGGNGRKIDNFQALLYSIARNSVVDFYRRQNKELETVEYIDSLALADPQLPEHNPGLQRALYKLKDLYREVILLRYIEGYSAGEIAQITKRSRQNVRVIIHRGLKALKELYHEEPHPKSQITESNRPSNFLAEQE